MKNKFLIISLTTLVSVLILNKAEADTIQFDVATVVNYEVLTFCESDTVLLYSSLYPEPHAWVYWIEFTQNGIAYIESPYVVITANTIYYYNTNDFIDSYWDTDTLDVGGIWTLHHNITSQLYFYTYFNTPIAEPFPNPTENICGASGTLYSGHYEPGIYYTWWQDGNVVAEGYYPNDTSFTYYTSGEYVLEMIGGCNTVRDTVNITLVDNTLPDLGPDVIFCGEGGMTHQVDCHPLFVYDSYTWSTGESGMEFIQFEINTIPGTYQRTIWVDVTNECLTIPVRDSVLIFEYIYPPLHLGLDREICAGSTTTLDMGFAYEFMAWYESGNPNVLSFNPTITVEGDATFVAYVQVSTCPSMIDTIHITALQPYDQTKLCIATVDTSGFNKIVWNKEYDQGISHYNIYRLNIGYDLVGSVDFSEPAVFYDQTANPMSSAYRYKISAVDTCGHESALSTFHGTIHITSNAGTAGGIDLTITDHYIDESGEFVPPFYHVMIDSTNNGELNAIAQMSSVFNSYHIDNPYPGASYALAAELPWTCDPNAKAPENYAISNKSVVYTGIANVNVSDFEIYPNPATETLNIITPNNEFEVEIVNVFGQVVIKERDINKIDITGLDAGSYIVSVWSKGKCGKRSLIVY